MALVIIPAYNEERTIAQVVRSVRSVCRTVVVVDDGSSDRTAEIAHEEGGLVLRHALNCGLGAAIRTGIAFATLHADDDIICTFDADGQMDVNDLGRLVAIMEQESLDVVTGSRFLGISNTMPVVRRWYNTGANLMTWMLFGVLASDSQSGLRCFRRSALNQMELYCDRMEVSSEIIAEIHRLDLRWKEIPVSVVYTPYSLSKGQGFATGLTTITRLLLRKF